MLSHRTLSQEAPEVQLKFTLQLFILHINSYRALIQSMIKKTAVLAALSPGVNLNTASECCGDSSGTVR